jgi:HD superfamily phosphohydrolase YqeK
MPAPLSRTPDSKRPNSPRLPSVRLLLDSLTPEQVRYVRDMFMDPVPLEGPLFLGNQKIFGPIFLDRETLNHSRRVALLSYWLSLKAGSSISQARTRFFAGLLHDIGKADALTRAALNIANPEKPSALLKKRHVEVGEAILRYSIRFYTKEGIFEERQKEILEASRFHHYFFEGYDARIGGLDTRREPSFSLTAWIVTLCDQLESSTNRKRNGRESRSIREFLRRDLTGTTAKLRRLRRILDAPRLEVVRVFRRMLEDIVLEGMSLNALLHSELDEMDAFFEPNDASPLIDSILPAPRSDAFSA